jgi:hypothetical protein
VLFTTAVDIINTLAAAQSAGQLKRELNRYLKPAVGAPKVWSTRSRLL